jgi:uncharacterized protein YjhX (UPF0386 family)
MRWSLELKIRGRIEIMSDDVRKIVEQAINNEVYVYTKAEFDTVFADLKRNKLAGNALIGTGGTIDTDYYNACMVVDRYIRQETLKTFKDRIDAMAVPNALKEWILMYAQYGYGNVETDHMLTTMECYPPELKLLIELDETKLAENPRG